MKASKETLVTYKREKDKVEISGDGKDVKVLIWTDMITSKLWIILVIILQFTMPKASFLPVVWQWLKNQKLFMTPFVAAAGLLLSG